MKLVVPIVPDPRKVTPQVLQCHLVSLFRKGRDVAPHAGLELELAAFDQLSDARRRERHRDASDAELGPRGDREAVSKIRETEALRPGNVPTHPDRNGQAGDGVLRHEVVNDLASRRDAGCSLLGGLRQNGRQARDREEHGDNRTPRDSLAARAHGPPPPTSGCAHLPLSIACFSRGRKGYVTAPASP